MRGNCNPAVKEVVSDEVVRDEVVMRRTRFVANEDSARVMFDRVIRDRGISYTGQCEPPPRSRNPRQFQTREDRGK